MFVSEWKGGHLDRQKEQQDTRYKSEKSDSSQGTWRMFWNGFRLDRRLVVRCWRGQVQSLWCCGSIGPRVCWLVFVVPAVVRGRGCAFSWRD